MRLCFVNEVQWDDGERGAWSLGSCAILPPTTSLFLGAGSQLLLPLSPEPPFRAAFPSPPSLSSCCSPAPSVGTGIGRAGAGKHTPQYLGLGRGGCSPALGWRHEGTLMGTQQGQASAPPPPTPAITPGRYLVSLEPPGGKATAPLGVAPLLRVGAGGQWKEMQGSASCGHRMSLQPSGREGP